MPPDLDAALRAGIADARFGSVALSASIWIDGYGEVIAHDADRALFPASNQKLLTAFGALSELPADLTFTTEVRVAGDELVVVAGGDPTLTRTGPNSLDALAKQVHDAGIDHVAGDLVVDESRQERARAAEGWQDWQIPTYAGPLSAFVVDDNRFRSDDDYLAQPAIGNGDALRDALRRHGVTIDGDVVDGAAPLASTVVASTTSAPVPALVADMLLRSDNETAEMLTREIGRRASTGPATTAAGARAVEAAIERELCVTLTGHSGDGSGLSRADLRSARELRTVFQAMLSSPWGPQIDADLPVAGRTGTLAGRFRGTLAEGNLRAKTGSIIGGRALTGHLRTAGGREAVFSLVVNGNASPAAQGAMDALVVTLAADAS